MEQATSEYREKTFTCQSCDLSSPFTYYGQKPPNTRAIVLLEECFVTQDPFSPDKEKFLVLGSTCSLCSRCVCVGSDCSLFYTKRFCMQCVNKHLQQFPPQIQSELSKKKQNSNLFYTKRFCMQCVNKHLQQFPPQTQSESAKKKQNSKSAIS